MDYGVIVQQRMVVPLVDPFFLHNTSISAEDRTYTYASAASQGSHTSTSEKKCREQKRHWSILSRLYSIANGPYILQLQPADVPL